MLDTCTIEERWSGVNDMIERWLEERQKLIVEFCAVGGVHEDGTAEKIHESLQKFCQHIVDYFCTGHFEVYYQLLREAEEFQDGSAKIAKALLPELEKNTSEAMVFNDSYANASADKNLDDLPQELSKLGELMELRFEIEDRLIDVMHNAHKELVTSEA